MLNALMQFLTKSLAPLGGAALLLLGSCSTESGPEGPVPLLIQEPARSIAANADTWMLLALDPSFPEEGTDPDTLFHGHAILGAVNVSDADAIRRLSEALNQGIEANDGMVAGCFNPRHGISVATDEGSVDLSICFECLQIYVYGPGGERVETVLTMSEPSSVFNGIYRDAGLTIAK